MSILTTLAFVLCTSLISAQVVPETERFQPVQDTTYVDSLCNLARSYFHLHHNDSVVLFATQALHIAIEHDMPKRQRNALFLLALGKHNLHAHAEAIELYRQYIAASHALHIPYDTSILLLNLAKCHTHLGDVEAGIAYFDSAYHALDPHDYQDSYEYYYGLAWFFHKHNVHDRALELRRRLVRMATAAQDSMHIAWSTYCLGYEHNAAGTNDSARHWVTLAVPLAEVVKDRYLEWNTKACLGIIELQLGNLESGVEWLLDAEPIGAEFGENICCGNGAFLALALIKQGRTEEAQRHLTQAESQLSGIADKEDKRNVLNALSQAYEHLGLATSALQFYKQMERLEDTLAQEAYRAEVAVLDVRHKTRDLLAKIAVQDRLLIRNASQIRGFKKGVWILGVLIGLILLAWSLEYRNRRRKMRGYLEQIRTSRLMALSPQEGLDASPMHQLEQSILQRLDDPELRIADIAKATKMSQRSLNRVVREASGMTPVQLVRALRIEKAKVLLSGTSKTIAEIAYETGFTEPSYFTKVFKKTQGTSPTAWRKALAA